MTYSTNLGQIHYNPTTGTTTMSTSTGTYAVGPNGNYIGVSPEDMEKSRQESEYRNAFHQERMDALKSHFPRAHQHIQHLDIMEDIARENQLNPLYEQVLKDFDEAKAAMSRAANKLASAVKLTDLDEIEVRTKKATATLYGNTSANWHAYNTVAGTASPAYYPSYSYTSAVTAATASATAATSAQSASMSASGATSASASATIPSFRGGSAFTTSSEETEKNMLAKFWDMVLGRK